MNIEIVNAWAAGLFEGEGTFGFDRGRAKSISITSTDKDVIDRISSNFGGNIYFYKKRKDHHKDSYVWTISGEESKKFYNTIKPFLLSRRSKRGEEWITSKNHNFNVKYEHTNNITNMFNLGMTHKEIADKLGLERSSITKFLNRRNLRRIKKEKFLSVA